jgi:hypothetical protein
MSRTHALPVPFSSAILVSTPRHYEALNLLHAIYSTMPNCFLFDVVGVASKPLYFAFFLACPVP